MGRRSSVPCGGPAARQGYHAARHGTADQRRREAVVHTRRRPVRDQPVAHRHGPRALRARPTTSSTTGRSTSWPGACSTAGGVTRVHANGSVVTVHLTDGWTGEQAARRHPRAVHLLPAGDGEARLGVAVSSGPGERSHELAASRPPMAPRTTATPPPAPAPPTDHERAAGAAATESDGSSSVDSDHRACSGRPTANDVGRQKERR